VKYFLKNVSFQKMKRLFSIVLFMTILHISLFIMRGDYKADTSLFPGSLLYRSCLSRLPAELGKMASDHAFQYHKIQNKKCWEELIAYFPLTGHGQHRKRRVQQFFYCCVCIRCRGNVFTEPLPSNNRRDTHRDTQTDGRDL
jgi:hypothetical protein